jgi:hypothetical protein
VETFFSSLTRQRIQRGSLHSIVSLQAAMNRYLDDRNAQPTPFVWTASAASIRAELNRLPVSSELIGALGTIDLGRIGAMQAKQRWFLGCLTHTADLVGGQVVADDNVARLQGWTQHLLNIGEE